MEGRRENVHGCCLDRDRKGRTAEPRAGSSPLLSPRPPPSSGADFDGVEHLIKGEQE